jgi:hypothetical protein
MADLTIQDASVLHPLEAARVIYALGAGAAGRQEAKPGGHLE